jgi:hypothetical protein
MKQVQRNHTSRTYLSPFTDTHIRGDRAMALLEVKTCNKACFGPCDTKAFKNLIIGLRTDFPPFNQQRAQPYLYFRKIFPALPGIRAVPSAS